MIINFDFSISSTKSFSSLKFLFTVFVLSTLMAIIVIKYSPYKWLTFVLSAPSLCTSLVSLKFLLSQFSFVYFKKKLLIQSQGITDNLSFMPIGGIIKSDIRELRLGKSLGIEHLRVRLIQNSKTIQNLKEPKKFFWELYQLLFQNYVYIPLNIFQFQKLDLLQFLEEHDYNTEIDVNFMPPINLDAVLKNQPKTKRKSKKEPMTSDKKASLAKHNLKNNLVFQQSQIQNNDEPDDDSPLYSPYEQNFVELYEILSRNSFKKFLKNPDFSEKFFQFQCSSKGNKNTVSGLFEETHFKFELENEEEDNIAHLSFYVSGVLSVSIVLEIEIGEMNFLKTTNYTPGEWEETYNTIDQLVRSHIKWKTKVKSEPSQSK